MINMKKIVKNTTVVALSGVMAIGMLSGCGSKSIDGEKTVATVDGTDIPMGVVSLYARESQAQTVATVSYTHLDVYKRQSLCRECDTVRTSG